MRQTALSAVLVSLALLVGACDSTEPPDSATAVHQAAELNAFLDAVFEREVSESPIRQSRLGRLTDRLDEWDDFSDAYAEEQIEQRREDLEKLRSFDREALPEADQISYDLFELNAQQAIDTHAFRKQFYVVDQFNGQVSDLLTVLQNNHPIKTTQDAENYIARIAGLENVLGELTTQLRDRADLGIIPPAFSFPAMLADARSMADGAALATDFSLKIEELEVADAVREGLRARAAQALEGAYKSGFRGLIAELERLEPLARDNGNKGVWSLPDGEAFYRNRVRAHTTLDLSADEIHAIGLVDVERIHEEMRAIQEQVGFDGSLQDFFEFIRNDPNNYFEDSDAGRQAFLEEARGLVAEIYAVVGDWFHRLPKAELEVRRVEPWRENSTSIAFYNRPSEDGSRPGIYYANLADMKSVQKYVFTAITYHESVPGHHFQIALAQELPGLPKFRKFGGYNAYTEGWALYGERLAKEMGFYQEPLRDFGRLQDEIWRSVRLVVDTGIHEKRWTRQQAIDYFTENTPISEGDIITEVERYFVNPGQALGYKMGMIKILELRDRAEAALGDAFDIRDFHDVVIGSGSLSLPVLERQVERYIEAEKNA